MADDPLKAQREELPEVTPDALLEWSRSWRDAAGLVSDGWANIAAALLRELGRTRYELSEERGKPTTCKVWRDGVLVFSGRDHSADLEAGPPAPPKRPPLLPDPVVPTNG